MARYLSVKDFERYQHYKDRKPPWVKLYRDVWTEHEFARLTDSEKLLAIGMLTLASLTDNRIPYDQSWMSRVLALKWVRTKSIESLIQAGYLVEDASTLLASSASPSISISVLDPDPRKERESEREKTKPKPKLDPAKSEVAEPADEDGLTPQNLFDGWNEICGKAGLPRARFLTGARKKKALARIKEHPEQEFWEEVMTKIIHSPFCCGQVAGKNGAKPWKASFSWLIEKEDNAVKALEGNYTDG